MGGKKVDRGQRRARGNAVVLALTTAALLSFLGGCSNSGSDASRLPPGKWGQVISCLEGHPLFKVYDAYSTNAGAPNARTKAVSVWQTLKGVALAYVGNSARGADDLTGTGDTDVNDVAGPIRYGFSPNADSQNQLDISNCVQNAYPATAQTTSPATVAPTTTTSSAPLANAYSGTAPNANVGPATDQ